MRSFCFSVLGLEYFEKIIGGKQDAKRLRTIDPQDENVMKLQI
jgi:hypothetical protein